MTAEDDPLSKTKCRLPGGAFSSIIKSKKRYVPLAFAVFDTIFRPPPIGATLAFARFSPRTRMRTGLIECPAHQPGGSILKTSGACANAAGDRKTNPTNRMDNLIAETRPRVQNRER